MISIIIPTHNRPYLLQRAIQSVVSQTYKDIEIVVVDDASTLNNKKVIDKFEVPIIYYKYETNQGGNACRNKGVELSSGEYVAFLDDDDEFLPTKLEEQINLMVKDNIVLSYTGKNMVTIIDDKKVHERYSYAKAKSSNLKKEIMKNNFIGTTSSIMIKKSSFIEVSGFALEMPSLQDYEFYLRFIHNGFRVMGIDKPLINYYIHKNSNAISKSLKKNFYSTKLILTKNKNKKYFLFLILSLAKITLKKIIRG